MTEKELREQYDKCLAQAGDTDLNFYEWAINHLLSTKDNKETIKTIKRHLKGIDKSLDRL
jgi:hypothetical protein